ncbi:hypothetical protein [Azohydromonas aeria]|uniref:hypothetical protein n=1 Tax=Azohydromonas aeria TaxID=2590212 RepID=UPI0012F74F62|nr:hypothetical protein [Azohydromonas aeria]
MTTTPRVQAVMMVAWPSFLMAAVLEMLVFALVDPRDLLDSGALALDLSAMGVYSLAFFLFWAAIAAAGALERSLATPSGSWHGIQGH